MLIHYLALCLRMWIANTKGFSLISQLNGGGEFERTIKAANKKEKPNEQKTILRDVGNFLAKHIRRDKFYEEDDLMDGLALLQSLKDSRKAKGFGEDNPPNEEHPSILALEAQFLILQWRYSEAAELLSKAVEYGKAKKYKNQYPVVANLFSLCFCLSQIESYFEEALERAKKCREYSEEVAAQSDWRLNYQEKTLAPVREMDPRVFGRLSELDVRVHSKEWIVGGKIEGRFQTLWENAVAEFDFPKAWRTDIKVMMLSDDDWATKVPGYALDVGKGAYIELGGNVASRIIRHIRSNYGGFDIDFGLVAKPLLILLCVGMLQQYGTAVSNLSVAEALEQQEIEIVFSQSLNGIEFSEVRGAIRNELEPEFLERSIDDVARVAAYELDAPVNLAYVSSGDQTTELI
ncbi:hypothetical protein [Imhoffiella purpurea]|uniref:hypothetical protein n=1 Tax=Imhoffiella purpurea TaxID=1249627 RepID=UPI0012FE5A8F|nr:hypothetical protein [Imhoffiella purpurea]